MRILVIDNNIDPRSWGAADLARATKQVPGATISVRRAPQNDLPKDILTYDRIIVSGSKTSALDDAPWIERLHEITRRAINEGKPFLGVCYGHQTLARALGGKETVRKAPRHEIGWGKIEVIEPAELLKGLPRTFHSYQCHLDEVCALPPGMKQLARSEACEIQAMRLEGKPVYGIQFHPEKTLEEGERSLAGWKRGGKMKSKDFLNADGGKRLYDAAVCETLFKNFLTS